MTDEANQAKAYWAALPFAAYHQDGPQRRIIVEALQELGKERPISSVLEFGCNVGRTLHLLSKTLNPGARLVGVDVNEGAVAEGRRAYGLDLRRGGEDALTKLGDGEFDCAFTVSVFDHLPDFAQVRGAIVELQRIARRYLLLLEPFDGTNRRAVATETAVQFNYYWDYPTLLGDLGLSLVDNLWYPLGYGTPMQSRYRLYVVALEAGGTGLSARFNWRHRLERASWMLLHRPAIERLRRGR